jgi:hypothetical protein
MSGQILSAPKGHQVPGPDHPITIEHNPNRVVVTVAGRVVADTRDALVPREAGYPAVHYVPRHDHGASRAHGPCQSTQLGRTAGGGVEYALSWNWFIKAEYLYVSFSNQTAAQVVSGGAGTGTVTGNLTGSIVRAGFDYRF